MKHKIIYKTLLVVMLLATLSSCKKDEEASPGTNSSAPIPTTLVGTWQINNADMPRQALKDKYDKMVLTVTATDEYSLKYYEKGGDIDDFTGKVVAWDSDEKHTNGQLIRYININVEKINGKPFPGGWKGIYAFEAGNILKINLDPNLPGIFGATPRGGFGSGDSGKEGIYHFKKQ